MSKDDVVRCAFCLDEGKNFHRGSAITRLFDGMVVPDLLSALERNGIYHRRDNVAEDAAFVHICVDCALQFAKLAVDEEILRGREDAVEYTPRTIHTYLDRWVVGQARAKKTLAIAVYKHYARTRMEEVTKLSNDPFRDVKLKKANVLLLGPTGTGKTLLVETIAKYLDVPFVSIDATTITESGYVGKDADHCIRRLLQSAGGVTKRAEKGIVYIDEIDKIASAQDASSTRDVGGEGAQQALLKLVEGMEVEVPSRSESGAVSKSIIDTSGILFIASGAFPGLREIITKRLHRCSMGFQACPQSKSEDAVSLKDVTTEDLKQYGLIGEFLGRFPVVDALDALSRDEMLAVLKEPKNSLLNQFRKLFYFEGIELNIEDAVLEHIVDRAMKIGTGARALQSEFESVFSELLYDIPDRKIAEPNLVSVRIDEAYLTAKHVRYGYAAEDPRPRQRRAQS